MTRTKEPTEKANLIGCAETDRREKGKPWTAPDYVELSTCAEIGAYAMQEKVRT